MTPEELKAKELVEKFEKAIWKNGNPHHVEKHAKECALILCNEILSLKMIDNMGRNDEYSEGEYWQKVKEQIQKL